MTFRELTRDDHFRNDGRPKRILTLDGGGLRGVLSLGILERIEALLRERHGGAPDFRLCHYFDLMVGTSTGAIIAAALAQGWSVADLRERYLALGRRLFNRSLLREGLLRARYDKRILNSELKELLGADTTLGSPRLLTGLLVVTKRLDTGSVWPLGNNPRGKYFSAESEGSARNADYLLWQVVRASTAAPSYFEPETITISSAAGSRPVVGTFVDGAPVRTTTRRCWPSCTPPWRVTAWAGPRVATGCCSCRSVPAPGIRRGRDRGSPSTMRSRRCRPHAGLCGAAAGTAPVDVRQSHGGSDRPGAR